MIAYIGDAYTPMLISKGGVGVKQLQRTPCRIAVATGIKKARAVTGALRTGLITHLFVDSQLASAVMAGSGAADQS